MTARIVSNGPFKVDKWNHGQSLIMSKHDGYWDAENITLTNVVEPISPATNEVTLYESGSGDQRVDWARLTASTYERYTADPNLSSQVSPYVYSGHLDAAARR